MSSLDPNAIELEVREWEGRSIRRQAVEMVARETSAEVLSYSYARVGDRLVYTNVLATPGVQSFEDCEGVRATPDSIVGQTSFRSWSVARPTSRQHNRFSTFEEDYGSIDELRGEPTFEFFYAPKEITDQARALLFDGGRFLGFLGAMRQGGDRFEPETLERVRSKTALYRRLFVLAHAAEVEEVASTLHLILDESGRPLHANELAAAWLTPRRVELLGRIFGRKRPALDGLTVEWCWLDDGNRRVRHVALSAAPGLRVSSWSHLSETQRAIADLARRGLSNREIAEVHAISPSTVKYHLRQIFEKTDAQSRVELSAVRKSTR